jgi:hypothetical protein
MVSTVVSAFARGGNYRVTFDESMSTAGTDLIGRKVVITPMPLKDPTLSIEQAAEILTGLAAHEVSHDRYGRATAAAVTREFGDGHTTAQTLSNILDEPRIERRFADEYPGYAGIFKPLLAYVAMSGQTEAERLAGTKTKIDHNSSATNIAVSATRYDEWVEWESGLEDERQWWLDWSSRWSREDSPKRHVEGVREALVHIGESTEKIERQPGQGSSAGSGDDLPSCVADGAAEAAVKNGATGDPGSASRVAEEAVRDSKNYEDNGSFGRIDVMKIVKTPRNSSVGMTGSSAAAAAIRNAFMRARGGYTAVSRGHNNGRLDSTRIDRVASGRFDVFSKKSAPSPKRVLAWVMIDCSGSMGGTPIRDAASVARALADASKTADNVRMAVFGWSDPFRNRTNYTAAAGVAKVWETGQPTDEVFRLVDLPMGGTPDAACVNWAAKAIRAEARNDEKPLLIVGSDGCGDYRLADVVRAARKSGVDVRSVALGSGDDDYLASVYGRDGVIKWAGSIIETARPLARLILDAMK